MTHRCRDERGSISIWLATTSFVMIVLVGLAVDVGGQVHAQQRVRDVAAQAARTGAQQVQAAPAIQGRDLSIDAALAKTAAEQYLKAAGVEGSVSVQDGDTITVEVSDTHRTRFLGLIGIAGVNVTGAASARLVRTIGGAER